MDRSQPIRLSGILHITLCNVGIGTHLMTCHVCIFVFLVDVVVDVNLFAQSNLQEVVPSQSHPSPSILTDAQLGTPYRYISATWIWEHTPETRLAYFFLYFGSQLDTEKVENF